MSGSSVELEKAETLFNSKSYDEARDILQKLAFEEVNISNEEAIRVKSQAILVLGSLLKSTKQVEELAKLIQLSRGFLKVISKAKASKLIRTLVDYFLDMEAGVGCEIALCKENIQWALDEERTFLRQSLEARLIALYYANGLYDEALTLGSKLLQELKKIDDKNLLVDVQLLESQVYYAVGNVGKSRAALTSAKTTANAIYCPPKLQASLDMQSGILHAAENDFKTAFSYFYEAFDGYDSVENKNAVIALKYMLLCKIMLNSPEDVNTILTGKVALKYAGDEIDSMKSIAQASQNRSLADFEDTIRKYQKELKNDKVVILQLSALYDTLIEQNLLRLIEPFSHVEISHIAKLINRSKSEVEKKLSTMILDKKLKGIIDQNAGVLVIFYQENSDSLYTEALSLIQHMGKVVDALFTKAKVIS